MPAYYNEFDPGAAAWLRELIKRGLIADGEVDDRSIVDVRGDDLRGFTQCHFFAGIGGWSYALRLAGWPDDRPVWTGSPPCQPFSNAGRQKGKDDDRHLTPHFADLVADIRPPVIVGEQVASAAVLGTAAKRAGGTPHGEAEWAWIDDLFGRLEAAHYACGAVDLPAACVGAPHIRQRLWFVGLADAEAAIKGMVGSSSDDRLAQPHGGERGWLTDGEGCQPDGAQAGWQQGDGEPERGGADERLADAHKQQFNWCGNTGARRRQEFADFGADGSGLANAGGSSSPHGGWADADWLFCRDGKWRPVEPASQRMANGVSLCLGSLRDLGCSEIEEEVKHAAHCAGLGGEVLRMLRSGHDPQEVWFALGGRFGFPVSTLLFAVLCKHQRELGFIHDGSSEGGEQDGSGFVREMRRIASQAARASQGCELGQQFSEKLGDALSKLPQDSAPYRQLVGLIASYNAGPLAHGVSGRVGRLRGYGNAIVPQVAAEFIRAVMEAI